VKKLPANPHIVTLSRHDKPMNRNRNRNSVKPTPLNKRTALSRVVEMILHDVARKNSPPKETAVNL
jgi:hypothetical protein